MENIRFLNNIYLGEGMEQGNLEKLKQDLNDRPLFANVFVITISANEHDQLDIYHAKYLMQRFYKKNPPYVIGIAKKHDHAVALVEKIVKECVTLRGDVNLKAYLVGE